MFSKFLYNDRTKLITGKYEKYTSGISTNSEPAYIIYPFGLEIDTDFKGHLSTMGITRMPRYMLN